MKHRMILKKVGPLNYCEIDIDNFTILTGAQASGKSTVAKALYFFRTVKDDLLELIVKRVSLSYETRSLHTSIVRSLRYKFLQLFGTSRAMDNQLFMQYSYDNNTYVKISLRYDNNAHNIMPNYVYIEFSKNISDFINSFNTAALLQNQFTKEQIIQKLNKLFSDDYETIFIPAGRNLITLLSNQLNFIFTLMDDEQKRTIDFCTQKYVERILKIRSIFSEGIEGFFNDKKKNSIKELNSRLIQKCIDSTQKILKGKYVFADGEERLIINNNRFVKINYTSSGQQETVWIFNILLYQLITNTKSFIILEEPESHLYPDSQKEITELLAMFMNAQNSILITTHSPYILGSVNNLLYARQIYNKLGAKPISDLIDFDKTIDNCDAYFVSNGAISSCIIKDEMLLQNEVIDGASSDINNMFDQMLTITEGKF